MLPLGPQLIGETEQALQALLRRVLGEAGLTEREWVALRLADQAATGVPLVDCSAIAPTTRTPPRWSPASPPCSPPDGCSAP